MSDDTTQFQAGVFTKRSTQEFKLHIAILKHINSCFIGSHNPNLKVFHIPNQNRDAKEGYFNKMMGILPGASDLIAGWPNNTGVLEIKASEGKLSSAQNRFISWAKLIGWHTGEARTVRAAHMVLLSWGLKAAHESVLEPDYRDKQQKFKDAFDWNKPDAR